MRNLRFAWRVLAREPAYSAVAVLGLAVALAACFLLFALVRYAWTYNAGIAAGGVVVVKERRNIMPRPDWGEQGPPPLLDAALEAGLVRNGTRAKPYDLAMRVGERLLPVQLSVAAPNYLRFFGIRALAGDADAALARPDALVVSRSEAQRLFGTADALGRTAMIDGATFSVRAVIPDLPPNTSPDFGVLVGEGRHSWDQPTSPPGRIWNRWARLYLRPAPGLQPDALAGALEDIVATRRDAALPAALTSRFSKPYTSIRVTPLPKVFFDADLLAGRGGERYGSPAAVAGLAGLGVVILLLAATNYVNLAAVRTAARRREIGVRKALGVGGPGLAAQFLAESLLVGAVSTAIGTVLAWLLLPLFSELAGRPLAGSVGWMAWALMIAIGLATGLASGAYPAWLAARVPASSALGGRDGATLEGYRMRRLLSVAQFAAAIALVAASLVVWWQARFASEIDPGFDPRQQLVVALPDKADAGAVHAFKAELLRLPAIEDATAMSEAAGRDGMKIIRSIERPSGERVMIEQKGVGANFFQVFGLRPVAGRLFAPERGPEQGVVLNAQGALAMGFASPEAAVGQMLDADNRIVGIAPDLRYQSLRDKPGPILYEIKEEQGVVTARARGSLAQARTEVEVLWRRHFPNDVPAIETATAVFAANYSDDLRQARLLALSSLVATALACCGIFVLSSYTVRRRGREFVLRKLHGASPRQIGLLVAREWLALLALGAALACGPAWLWSTRYLAPFVERAPMGAWPLVLAVLGVGVTALAACLRQAVRAMRLPPALVLRD